MTQLLSAVAFTVHGEPKAAQRPQVVRRGKARVAIKADADTAAQAAVQAAFLEALHEGPGGRAAWPTLETTRAYRVEAHFRKGTFGRSDLDNLLKTVLDGLTGTAYPDDHQVVEIATDVSYAPRLESLPGFTFVVVRRLPRTVRGRPLPLWVTDPNWTPQPPEGSPLPLRA